MAQEERRDQKREFLVSKNIARTINIFFPYEGLKSTEAELLNISSSGICFSTVDLLKKSDLIIVRLPLSSEGQPMIPTLGEVRWIKTDVNRKKRHTVGIRYVL